MIDVESPLGRSSGSPTRARAGTTADGAGPERPTVRPGRLRRLVRFVLVAVTTVLLVDAVFGEKGLLALLQARREFAAVERALEQARADNEALREAARRLREDPATIESVARRDLGLIKPGEKLFIIRDAAPRK